MLIYKHTNIVYAFLAVRLKINQQQQYFAFVHGYRCLQHECLATGDSVTVEGGLTIDDDNLTVWVDNMTKILVTCDGVSVQEVDGGKWMEQPDGRLAFQRGLTEKEKSSGLKVYRAFAVLKDKSESNMLFNH